MVASFRRLQGKISSSPLCWLLLLAGSPWFLAASLQSRPLSSRDLLPLCLCVLSPLVGIPVTGFRAHPSDLIFTNYICKDYFQIRSHPQVLGLDVEHVFLGDNSTHPIPVEWKVNHIHTPHPCKREGWPRKPALPPSFSYSPLVQFLSQMPSRLLGFPCPPHPLCQSPVPCQRFTSAGRGVCLCIKDLLYTVRILLSG